MTSRENNAVLPIIGFFDFGSAFVIALRLSASYGRGGCMEKVMIDTGKIAQSALELAYFARGEITLKLDVETMTAQEIKDVIDGVLKHRKQFNVRIKGCRVDFSTQGKLGLAPATANASTYQGIYFVTVAELDFGQLEIVLEG